MLKSALRYIRQKPKAVRNQYALALSALFTGVVVIVWLASGASSLNDVSSIKVTEGNTPFSNLIKQAKDQFASSKEALTKAEQGTSSIATTTTSSTSEEMILTAETLLGIDQASRSTSTTVSTSSPNFGFSGSQEATSTSAIQYIEVQIATTSASATPTTSPQ